METRSAGNWSNDLRERTFSSLNDGGHQSNGQWSNNNERRGHFANQSNSGNREMQGQASFAKFRDRSQQNTYFQNQSGREQGRGGGSRGGGRGSKKKRGHQKGRGGKSGPRSEMQRSPWYTESMPNNIYYYSNGQSTNDERKTEPERPVPPATSIQTTPLPAEAVKDPTPTITTDQSTSLLNLANIKKEKHETSNKQSTQPVDNNDQSSSSSDESIEPGEVVKSKIDMKSQPPVSEKPKSITQPASKPSSSSSSSSSEHDSSDESQTPVKTKTTPKEQKTSKSPRRAASEDDVVCMGSACRKYVIADDDDNEGNAETEISGNSDEITHKKSSKHKEKAALLCGICDKKGHTSFECQMICHNCSAPYHSFKNCPNPPNLNIAMQAFMEFTMQQMMAFNVDKQFSFPAGLMATPGFSAQTKSLPGNKAKKDKRKKIKKAPKKKIKRESNDSDEEDDDDDDEGEDEAQTEASSESDLSESSSEPVMPKSKRKRSSKPAAPSMPTGAPSAFPFPLLAAGAPYNPLMYPYGAQFKFSK